MSDLISKLPQARELYTSVTKILANALPDFQLVNDTPVNTASTHPSIDCLCPLSQAVVTVLRDVQVKDYLDHQEEKLLVEDILASIETIGGVRTTRELIQDVASKLADLIGYQKEETYDESSSDEGSSETDVESSAKTKIVMGDKGIGCPGKSGNGCSHNNGGGGSKCEGYQSSYKSSASISALITGKSDTSSTNVEWTTLAKIFLGCIPFIFSGLSYMYWAAGSGKWNSNTVNAENYLLCQFMKRMGYDTSKLKCGHSSNGNGTTNNGQNYPEHGITGQELHDIMKENALFKEFKDGVSKSFAEYLEEVRKKVRESVKDNSGGKTTDKEHALLQLNTLCTGYFRALNQPYRVHKRKPRLPRTIREILYWLSCVQYCPVFRVLVQKMQELCQRVGGDTGIKFYSEKKTCTITPSNCVSYFLSAALVAPMVLLSIQDTIECRVGKETGSQAQKTQSTHQSAASLTTEALTEEEKYHQRINEILKAGDNKVFIHDLYANTLFEFRFPMSETESYYLLQDCLVALYYQLYFLKQQCNWSRQSKDGDGFGWAFCRYGEGVNGDGCVSWICPKAGAAGNDATKNGYAQTLAEHTKACGQNGNTGGTNGTPSPLQAFLCDCLPGFSCKRVMGLLTTYKSSISNNYQKCYMEFLEHRTHLPVGQYCPIPMGFTGSFIKKEGSDTGTAAAGNGIGMSGLGINAITSHYANDDLTDSCLYQVTRCISSLTRRVPRSTGTLYGFFYGLGGVCQKNGGSNGQAVNSALKVEMGRCPGWRDPKCLMDALMGWTETDHIKNHKSGTGNFTLGSLHGCDYGEKDGNPTCGYYLRPLGGSLYNSVSRVYCDTYVSWIVHLTGVLNKGLESLLKEFTMVDCKNSGCKGENGNDDCKCKEKGCKPSTHGVVNNSGQPPNTKGCCCETIADCAGVLPLFYRFGFSFNSPGYVANHQKRKCDKFYQQLQIVIGGKRFSDLLAQIRAFLYTTRLPFTLMIFGFWLAVLGYLLWSLGGPLDLLHIQSHWRSPGSYLVPLQRILADGSRNVKRVCTMKYFSDGTGNGLLEQGINDLYL
ncbi:variant erythrocyte surface antigen beta subunit, putative [Babesia ovis]|uniref:Variant erythrocyte surface antigen beta subunit, putative n=1 Tax=Babesia ovis TaxID=5869 RepID=A0A9W5WWC8_BABOV|nr:variant erythrocyte surface antigen beta subunit, putative [Babesia ovis]